MNSLAAMGNTVAIGRASALPFLRLGEQQMGYKLVAKGAADKVGIYSQGAADFSASNYLIVI